MKDLLDQLTDSEEFELQECEEKIQQHLEGFWETVAAFTKIRELRLWRGKFSSMRQYCEQRWGMTDRRLRQLSDANEIRDSLPTDIADLITNERQIRALSGVEPGAREEVVRQAASQGPVTARSISEAAAKPRGRVERVVTLDEVGTPIPDDALPFWNRKQEAQDLLSDISRIKSIVTTGRETMDPFYLHASNAVIYDLQTIYQHLLELKPYAVCTQCQGTPSLQPDGCNFCKNSGLISKHQWDTQSMAEVKAMRLKANNARNGKH